MQTRCVIGMGNYQPAAKSCSNSQPFTFTGAVDKQNSHYISEQLQAVQGASKKDLTGTLWPFHLTSKISCNISKTKERKRVNGKIWTLPLVKVAFVLPKSQIQTAT